MADSLADRLPTLPPAARAACIFEFMTERGSAHYEEEVTQLEHALQCAHLAREHGSDAPEVTAALLHDLGHLLLDEHAATEGSTDADRYHEEFGAQFLAPHFDETVTEPIRLHVPAKRYLCTVEPDYYATLSDASKHSFNLQGGPLSDAERATFEQHPQLERALRLRRWDDLAKVTDLEVPAIESYLDDLVAAMRS